jgi:hypothetical protein
VLRNLKCLHLMEPTQHPWDRAMLSDGGAKFLLEVREVERLFSGSRSH